MKVILPNSAHLLTVIAILYITSIALSSEESGAIEGYVFDFAGIPLVGATVIVVGTSHGAMTDANGEYLIEDLEPGEYSLQASIVGLRPEVVSSVKVLAETTFTQDFVLLSVTGQVRPSEFVWPAYTPGSEITIVIELSPELAEQLSNLSIFSMGEDSFANRVRIISGLHGSEISITLPSGASEIVWSLPSISDQVENIITFEDGSGQVVLDFNQCSADSLIDTHSANVSEWDCLWPLDNIPDEWVAEGYEISSASINPWDYGNHEMAWAGFITYTAYWDSTASGTRWRILLMYTDHLTILEEGCEQVNLSFDMEVKESIFSLTGKYILAFQASIPQMAGEALLIDTESLNYYRFDPISLREQHELNYSNRSITIINTSGPEYTYYCTDIGEVIAYSDSVAFMYSLDNIAADDTCDILDFPVGRVLEDSNGNLYFLDDDRLPTKLIQKNPTGNFEQIAINTQYWYGAYDYSPYSNILVSTGFDQYSPSGLYCNDIRTGQNIWQSWCSEPISNIRLSADGQVYIASLPITWQMNQCILATIDEPEIPMAEFNTYSEDWILRFPITISADGKSFWRAMPRQNSNIRFFSEICERFVLISETGDLIWATPIRNSSLRTFQVLEPISLGVHDVHREVFSGNRLIWNDSRRIYITTIKKTDE